MHSQNKEQVSRNGLVSKLSLTTENSNSRSCDMNLWKMTQISHFLISFLCFSIVPCYHSTVSIESKLDQILERLTVLENAAERTETTLNHNKDVLKSEFQQFSLDNYQLLFLLRWTIIRANFLYVIRKVILTAFSRKLFCNRHWSLASTILF